MEYGKIIDNKGVAVFDSDIVGVDSLVKDGYKPLNRINEYPKNTQLYNFQAIREYFYETENEVFLGYKIIDYDNYKVQKYVGRKIDENTSQLELAKIVKLYDLEIYDKSKAVNEFTIDGVSVWLDKQTRAGLMLRFDAEMKKEIATTKLWCGTQVISLPIDTAISMLLAVELYASACYDVTAQHRANISALSTIKEIEDYDYKTGYPEKLTL